MTERSATNHRTSSRISGSAGPQEVSPTYVDSDDEGLSNPCFAHDNLELSNRRSTMLNRSAGPQEVSLTDVDSDDLELGNRRRTTWNRFLGKGKKKIGIIQSIKNIYGCSWLNLLLLLTPVAWWAHFYGRLDNTVVFALCFASIVPHECMFNYYGEQIALYFGKDIGDLITITLNNAIEVTLAIMLLVKCELKLLQSTITGVILLHLLLVPGAAFLTGGARIWEQDLHPAHNQLNHSLLTVGVLALLLPASFYAATSGSSSTISTNGDLADLGSNTETDFLTMSRGLAVLLLLVYICSRIFYHHPPASDGKTMVDHPNAPLLLKEYEQKRKEVEPEVNQWICMIFLILNIGIMAVTSAWLVDSINPLRSASGLTEEWFGLILLPVVSFSADGAVAAGYFVHKALRRVLSRSPDIDPPNTLAKAEAIDLSIQFVLLWMPFLTLLGWWTNKPFSLLFDFYEVALLLGACFLVNFVTADNKTNWAEGFILLSFYVMIVLCTWFYHGQSSVRSLMLCVGESPAAS